VSHSWYIYSTKSAAELTDIEDEYNDALNDHLSEHEECDDYVQVAVGGPLQEAGDYDYPEDIAIRLQGCRTTIEFEYVRLDTSESRIQASIVLWWLERLTPCLIQWADPCELMPSERAIAELKTEERYKKFGAPRLSNKPRRIKGLRARGFIRCEVILEKWQNAQKSLDTLTDFMITARSTTVLQQQYISMILQAGELGDHEVKRRLSIDSKTFKELMDGIDVWLSKL
jgi:hypothetical protein